MAWTDPGDFTSGQILTAAEMDNIREAMFFGQATFTNEAARDTAFGAGLSPITLQEGMQAYLTAPTIPSASASDFDGDPSGVTTIYNGSVWVCTTEVGATTHATGTRTGAGSDTYSGTLAGTPGTNPAVTLVTGTSALISLTCLAAMSGTASAAFMSVAVSGATTLAANDNWAAGFDSVGAGKFNTVSRTFVITGLTAGTNTFTLQYRIDTTAQTGTFTRRSLVVKGIA